MASGAALVLATAAAPVLWRLWRSRGEPPQSSNRALVGAALAMVGWELFGVAVGGRYWLHYLTGLAPGVTLLVCLVPPTRWNRAAITGCLSYTLLVTAVVWVHQAAAPIPVTSDAQVASYLRDHARPGDGVVVGSGHADIVAGSGLDSPYENLWSLPVRTRDPHLVVLGRVMAGATAPRWVVVQGKSLDSWGIDASTAQAELRRDYVEKTIYGGWHVWKRREANEA